MRLWLFSLWIGILCLGCWQQASGQYARDTTRRFRVYVHEGQAYMTGELYPIDITAMEPTARQLRRGRRRLARFTRLRWNVHKVYPYALKVSQILEDVQAHIDSLPDEKAKKEYLKSTETSLFGSYEKDLRRMTRSQGKVLVKLVYRQTGQSTFELIKDNKSSASAIFWQSIGLIFGINLKTPFSPDEEEEDGMIDYIVQELEQGGYNIAYKQYNYKLD